MGALDVLAYIEMLFALASVAYALGLGAVRMRRRLAPGWSGAPARLAEAILALTALVAALQLAGVAGELRLARALGTVLATGAAMALIGRGRDAQARQPFPRGSGREVAVAVGVSLLLVFIWSQPIATALDGGMTNGDTLWYHMPVAAQFAQNGSTTDVAYVGGAYLPWFYPSNSELLHSFGILLARDHDVLSPLISGGWLALAVLAAWCAGRSFGSGAACVAVVAPLLGSPLIVDRDPGMAHSDVAGIALLLAAIAVLVNAERSTRVDAGSVAIAGLAAGLAVGTKLTLLPPVAVLSAGVLLAARPRRWLAGGIWAGCLALTGSFWFVRNLAIAGNPLPWVRLGFGPVTLAPATPDPGGAPRGSVLHYAGDAGVWHRVFLPELHAGLGPLWPLLFAAAAAGVILALVRGSPMLRTVAIAAIAGVFAYAVNPLGAAGPEGAPTTFESNLRYLTPALAIGLVLLPTALPAGPWTRWTVVVGSLAALLATEVGAAVGGAHNAVAVAMTALAAAVALAVVPIARGRRFRLVVAAIGLSVCAVAGWPLTRHYLDDRYRERATGKLQVLHLGAAYKWASGVSGASIATTSILQYGLYGTDLSNRVRYLGVPGARGAWTDPPTCRAWRRTLDGGDFDYLVLAPTYEGASPSVPVSWVRSPNAKPILEADPTTVFRLSGPLPVNGC